jgi:hypothetical protein
LFVLDEEGTNSDTINNQRVRNADGFFSDIFLLC